MKIELNLDPEQLCEITRNSLIWTYNDASSPDVWDSELIKSLMTVIEYYSSKAEYEEFLTSITKENDNA